MSLRLELQALTSSCNAPVKLHIPETRHQHRIPDARFSASNKKSPLSESTALVDVRLILFVVPRHIKPRPGSYPENAPEFNWALAHRALYFVGDGALSIRRRHAAIRMSPVFSPRDVSET
jgi:hypothetical protein